MDWVKVSVTGIVIVAFLAFLVMVMALTHHSDVKNLRALHPDWTNEQVEAQADLIERHNYQPSYNY